METSFIYEPKENDFLSAYNIINVYDYLNNTDSLDFECSIKLKCDHVFYLFCQRFDESVREKVWEKLMIYYWSIYGPVDIDIPVYYRVKFNEDILDIYSLYHDEKTTLPGKNQKRATKFVVDKFWIEYAKLYQYRTIEVKQAGTKVKLERFYILKFLGINPKKINKKWVTKYIKLSINRKLKLKDIVSKENLKNPRAVVNALRKTFLFDACSYYVDGKGYAVSGKVRVKSTLKPLKGSSQFIGIYLYKGQEHYVQGSSTVLISTDKSKNYIPVHFFENVPFIKQHHNPTSQKAADFSMIQPISANRLTRNVYSIINETDILHERDPSVDIVNNFDNFSLVPELKEKYQNIYESMLTYDKETKRKWRFRYLTQYDYDLCLKFCLFMSKVNLTEIYNNQVVFSIKKDLQFKYKNNSEQNKKNSYYGGSVGSLKIFINIYKFIYTRKHQNKESQPFYVHPYSLWVDFVDPLNITIDNSLTIDYFNKLLEFVKLYNHMNIYPEQIESEYPYVYRNIVMIRDEIIKENHKKLFDIIFKVFDEYKHHTGLFDKKLYWICICILYKRFYDVDIETIDGTNIARTDYTHAYSINQIKEYVYQTLNGESMDNPFIIIPLYGTKLPDKIKNRKANYLDELYGMQIPKSPIFLPGINPLTRNVSPDGFDVYSLMLNAFCNIKFPIISKEYAGSEIAEMFTPIYMIPNIRTNETFHRNYYNIVVSIGQETKKPHIRSLAHIDKTQINRESKAGIINKYIIGNLSFRMLNLIRNPDIIIQQYIDLLLDTPFKYIFYTHITSDETVAKIKNILKSNLKKNTPYYRDLSLEFKYIYNKNGVSQADMNNTNTYMYLLYILAFKDRFNNFKNVIFKDHIQGLPVINRFQHVSIKYKNTKHIRRVYDSIIDQYVVVLNAKNKSSDIYIQKTIYDEGSSMYSELFYDYIMNRKHIDYKKYAHFCIQNKNINIFSHIAMIESITQTNIILLYSIEDSMFVMNRDNWFFKPQYKSISFIMIPVKDKIINPKDESQYISHLNNQQQMKYINETNKYSWEDRDWYFAPFVFSSNYISLLDYLYDNYPQDYKRILNLKNRNKLTRKDLSVYENKSMSTNVYRYKLALGFEINVIGDTIKYKLDVDPRDDIVPMIESALQRFTIGDNTPKDIGFIDDDGFIRTWVKGDKIYDFDGFSTYESCKRIVRKDFLVRYVNDKTTYSIYNKSATRNTKRFMSILRNPTINTQLIDMRFVSRVENIHQLNMITSMFDIDHETKALEEETSIILPRSI